MIMVMLVVVMTVSGDSRDLCGTVMVVIVMLVVAMMMSR